MHPSPHKGKHNAAPNGIKATFQGGEKKHASSVYPQDWRKFDDALTWNNTKAAGNPSKLLASSSHRTPGGSPLQLLYVSNYLGGSSSQILLKTINPSLWLLSRCPTGQTARERQPCFLWSQLCWRVSGEAERPEPSLMLDREALDWSSIPAFLLNVGFSPPPFKTNYTRETQDKIFCKAHFSHYPCQWTSNCPVIWDSLSYSLYPFWNNLSSQMRPKAYRTVKLK